MEILPHPEIPEQRIFLLNIERAEKLGSGDDPVIRYVATDDSEDRHGSVLNSGGWDNSQFIRNPVVLWSHQHTIPAIGQVIRMEQKGARWEYEVRYAIDAWDVPGMGNLSLLVYRLAAGNFIRAMSNAFIPKEWKDIEATTIPRFFAENVEYMRQELTETSNVNVGSNRNALKKALGDGVISEQEATTLGLGWMLRMEMPAFITSGLEKEQQKQSTATAVSRTPDGRVVETPLFGRDGVSMYAPAPVAPESPDAAGAAELQLMNDMAENCLDDISLCMAGWESIAVHESLRRLCKYRIIDSMNLHESLAEYAEYWYQVARRELPEAITHAREAVGSSPFLDRLHPPSGERIGLHEATGLPMVPKEKTIIGQWIQKYGIDHPIVQRKLQEADERELATGERLGAVLNKANKQKLINAQAEIQSVLDSAESSSEKTVKTLTITSPGPVADDAARETLSIVDQVPDAGSALTVADPEALSYLRELLTFK